MISPPTAVFLAYKMNKRLLAAVNQLRYTILIPSLPSMKKLILTLCLTVTTAWAGPIVNLDRLGEQLGGWTSKQSRAADYELSGSKYRTWKPEISPTLEGGLFISVRIDHLRGLFASDDHSSLQIILDQNGNIISAQSSMAFQGRKITSDAIRLGASAGTTALGVEHVAKVGTELLADLSAKLLNENVAEPGRVSFPAAIHHNYNLLCLSTGLLEETPKEPDAKPEDSQKVEQTALKVQQDKAAVQKTGKPIPLPTGS